MADIRSVAAEIRRGKKELEMWANAQPDGRPVMGAGTWGAGWATAHPGKNQGGPCPP